MAWMMKRRCAAVVFAMSAALLSACAVTTGCDGAACAEETARVELGGEVFCLELALDNSKRIPGLAFRESIDADGGMVFVFPRSMVLGFVMRDCLVDIDIAYLDGTGRVVSVHEMTVEAREEGEGDAAYEARLRQYSSRYAAVFAVEVRAGTLARLGVEEGDMVGLDSAGLKQRAR